MYIHNPRGQKKRDRNRSSRYRASQKAKQGRRRNRMAGKRLSAA